MVFCSKNECVHLGTQLETPAELCLDNVYYTADGEVAISTRRSTKFIHAAARRMGEKAIKKAERKDIIEGNK
jgi:hypothetical protein